MRILVMVALLLAVGSCSPMAVTSYDGHALTIRWEPGVGRENSREAVRGRAEEVCGGPVRLLLESAGGLTYSHFKCL